MGKKDDLKEKDIVRIKGKVVEVWPDDRTAIVETENEITVAVTIPDWWDTIWEVGQEVEFDMIVDCMDGRIPDKQEDKQESKDATKGENKGNS